MATKKKEDPTLVQITEGSVDPVIETTTTEEVIEESVDFGNLFEGVELSEEFKGKLKTIFESAVSVKVSSKVETITEEFETKFEEALEEAKTELTEKIDAFLNYATNEWVESNTLAIESGMKTEITEGFIAGLKTLFQESYIEVPEEKLDVLAQMEEKVEETEEKLNEQIEKNVILNKKVSGLLKSAIVAEESIGLTAIDAEKLKGLTEGVEFESESIFKEKVATLKESYFPKATAKPNAALETQTITDSNAPQSDHMKIYLDALNKLTF